MRDWALTAEDPYSLRIAADARTSHPSYVNDQIWELRLEGGEPPALALETSYGLRARGMRLFPAFHLGEQFRMDPASFEVRPTVRRFLTNYLWVEFQPFDEVLVVAEYWVPESDRVAGRLTLHNLGLEHLEVRSLMHALLRPDEAGASMTAETRQGVTVLSGRTGNLAPVVFLAGGAVRAVSAYPALRVNLPIEPGGSDSLLWAHAAGQDPRDSFAAARELAALNWDGEIARVERANARLLEIETGDEAWDAALAMAQKVSLGSYVGPTHHLPHASIVLSRSPDHGASLRADGRDHGWAWEGQSGGDAFMTALQVLPAAPELAKGLLLNFLAAQNADGTIDWKPGLGGQRKGSLCAPLLATLAWRIYQWTEERSFLEEVLPGLERFLQNWFEQQHDRDLDGHPEWDHIMQSGFHEWPTFQRWRTWGGGLDITLAETPDLAAYLLKEHMALIAIRRALGRSESIAELEARVDRLQEALNRGWSGNPPAYRHVDRDTHAAVRGTRLAIQRGEFNLELNRSFDPPVRVQVRVKSEDKALPAFQICIRGRGAAPRRRRVVRLHRKQFDWHLGLGSVTSQVLFSEIEGVEVSGLSDRVTSELGVADYSRLDQTCLLPLWAGAPGEEQAAQLVERTLLAPDYFWRLHGIPGCSAKDPAYAMEGKEGTASLWMLPNLLLGEGLVDYGYLSEAADLVGRLIAASAGALLRDKSFRESYHADLERGMGERDHAGGVAPLSLFLYVLGVRLITPQKVVLRGRNPFPWPIRLSWSGIEIRWNKELARVRFPDGAEVEVRGEHPQTVEQEALAA